MMEARPNIRKLALWFLGGVILIALFIWLIHYLTIGKITITTGNPYNAITLTRVTNDKSKPAQTFKAHSQLSVSVHTGQYMASVEGNSLATTQLIQLGAHKTVKYTINPINTSGVEPVAYQNASNIVADSSKLLYVNADENDNHIYKIDSQNNLTVFNSTQQFKTVKWASTSFGVGQDGSGRLYAINNGAVNQLNVPFSYNGPSVEFDLTPSKQIYISYGADIYIGDQNGKFKKIYTASSSSPVLATGASEVAVAVAPSDVGDTQKSELAIITTAGKIIKKGIEAHRLVWSPSGQYLLGEGSEASIYDSSLHKIAALPTNAIIGSAQWLDSSGLVYSINDQLWMYSLSNQRAELLANMPLGNYISGLSISSDKAYVYMAASDSSGNNPAIKRVGLRNQKVPKVIYDLQSILPLSLGSCSLSLINFTRPTVVVRSGAGQSQSCVQSARTELQKLGFDLSSLQILPSS